MFVNSAVLDTHTFLWFNEEKELKRKHIEEITYYAYSQQLYISSMSLVEIAYLHSIKRLKLDMPLQEWLKKALEMPGLKVMDITPDIAIESATLPAHCYKDICDRIIIATARVLGATLFTRDGLILELPSDYLKCIEI